MLEKATTKYEFMKIYLNQPKENWIVDRFVSEWSKNNSDITTKKNFKKRYCVDNFSLDLEKN